MNQPKPKAKPFLQFTAEEEAKVKQLRARQDEKTIKIDPEQYTLAEFGIYYGWSGIKAVLNNEIDGETMAYLIAGGRKVHSRMVYDQSLASFIGAASSKGKKPVTLFNKLTKNILKNSRPDL